MTEPDVFSTLITQKGLGVGLIAVFFGGLSLNLTPCVYPMIPVTLAFFGGQSQGRTLGTLRLAAFYVLGIALSYAALGLLASRTGSLLGAWLQQPLVLAGIAAVILGLSLSMFGLYDLQPPRFITERLGQASAGIGGALAMGLLVGLVAAPCVGPFLISLLLVASQIDKPLVGFLLFFVLGLGMGMPYLALALVANKTRSLPRAGAWLVWSKKILGCILIGLALHFLRPLLDERMERAAAVLLLAGSGAYLGWIERSRGSGKGFAAARWLVGLSLLAASVAVAVPAPKESTSAATRVQWTPFTRKALDAAIASGTPVIVDLYADWCIPCVELDHTTFRNPEVLTLLSRTASLRVDATRELSSDAQALVERYELMGVPTVLFIDRTGKEHPELRLNGFEPPERFLRRLQKLLDL